MRNQPKYHLIKNAFYALDGLKEVFKNETSFKLEVIISLILWTGLFFISIPFASKMILALSLFIVLIAELANSAVERTVDLFTQEHKRLAKHAKDAGSAMVLMALILVILIWASTLYYLIY